MAKTIVVLQIITPILVAVFLGIMARKRKILAAAEIEGMQRFVIKFCIPCLVFRSCLTADITPQALSSMVMIPLIQILGLLWAYRARKKQYPYHNLPFLFCCKETGMMGIPLFMVLFGAEQAYRVGVLDVAQAMIAFPMIGILSADPGADPTPKAVIKQMATSPLILLSILGITLNLSGLWTAIEGIGVGGIVLDTVSFLSQPVSAVMLFCVGYNFELGKGNRSTVFRLTATHVGAALAAALLVQAALFLVPSVDALTRWAALLYFLLPTSYLAPGLGRNQEDYTVASGMCSLTTVLCLAGFCVIAAITV